MPTVALPRPRPQLRRPRVPALPEGLVRRLAAPGAVLGLTLLAAYVRGTNAVRAPATWRSDWDVANPDSFAPAGGGLNSGRPV